MVILTAYACVSFFMHIIDTLYRSFIMCETIDRGQLEVTIEDLAAALFRDRY